MGSPGKLIMTGQLFAEDGKSGPMFMVYEQSGETLYHVRIVSQITGEMISSQEVKSSGIMDHLSGFSNY